MGKAIKIVSNILMGLAVPFSFVGIAIHYDWKLSLWLFVAIEGLHSFNNWLEK